MQQREPGMREVASLVAGTVIGALCALRVYAFIHDFGHGTDAGAWVTVILALLGLVFGLALLARTLGRA
jgi:hypothetical protein